MCISLYTRKEARDELRKCLKRREEIAISENDIQYKEIVTTQVFSKGDSKEFDVVIA